MNRILTSAVCLAASVAIASVADAQIVRVGPFGGVSIRAPFVSVDTLPFGGGARVRAPFTAVDTRMYARYPYYGYGYYRPGGVYGTPVYPAPVYPTPVYPQTVYPDTSNYQAARPTVPASNLPASLRAAAEQLKRSLSQRRDDSDVWLTYLAPDRIVEAIDSGATPESLRLLLLNYDGVVGNRTLASVRAASGFSQTHQLLRQFVASPASQPTPNNASRASEGNSILAPVPAPESNSAADAPTPAPRVRAADEGDAKEAEPQREDLPLPPQPTPL